MDKVRCTIREPCRDWSYEGAAERKACYDLVISDVVKDLRLERRDRLVFIKQWAGGNRASILQPQFLASNYSTVICR